MSTATKKSATEKSPAVLTAAEQTACDRIRPLMNENSVSDATAKYLIGTEVAGVMNDSEKYGKASVPRIARELGCTQVLLYTYAKVAETWTTEEFTTLTETKNTKGMSLTFTHFIAISKLDTKEARAALIADVLENSLTTRQTETRNATKCSEATPSLGQRVAKVAKLVADYDEERPTQRLLTKLEAVALDAAAAKKEMDALMVSVTDRIANVKLALSTPVSTDDLKRAAGAEAPAAQQTA
jgi:hypothetical protein